MHTKPEPLKKRNPCLNERSPNSRWTQHKRSSSSTKGSTISRTAMFCAGTDGKLIAHTSQRKLGKDVSRFSTKRAKKSVRRSPASQGRRSQRGRECLIAARRNGCSREGLISPASTIGPAESVITREAGRCGANYGLIFPAFALKLHARDKSLLAGALTPNTRGRVHDREDRCCSIAVGRVGGCPDFGRSQKRREKYRKRAHLWNGLSSAPVQHPKTNRQNQHKAFGAGLESQP